MARHPSKDRRAVQRETLIDCAEQAIASGGLAALRARNLADCVGCSVGAIYNLVADLDELTLLVAQRTIAKLNERLEAVSSDGSTSADNFVAWALAYCMFAADARNLWRALFEFRMAPGRSLPDWFEADRLRLFAKLEVGLSALMPSADAAALRLRARTLFSAVHGIVSLGLEEKIDTVSVAAVEAELAQFVRSYLAGLAVEPT